MAVPPDVEPVAPVDAEVDPPVEPVEEVDPVEPVLPVDAPLELDTVEPVEDEALPELEAEAVEVLTVLDPEEDEVPLDPLLEPADVEVDELLEETVAVDVGEPVEPVVVAPAEALADVPLLPPWAEVVLVEVEGLLEQAARHSAARTNGNFLIINTPGQGGFPPYPG